MSRLVNKIESLKNRKRRIRSRIHGTATRPRLTVKISNYHVTAQLIDDDSRKTLLQSTTVGKNLTVSMTEKAIIVGNDIAKKSKQAKISEVVFDRNGKLYHGRIKALADAARAEGLRI